MPVDFTGKWKIASHDDFGPMLDKLQVPAEKRPPSTITELEVDIVQTGDDIKITNKSPQGEKEHSFTVGDRFKLVMMVNMPEVEVASAWDGDRLVCTDDRGVKLTREIINDQIVSTFACGDAAIKLYFNKL